MDKLPEDSSSSDVPADKTVKPKTGLRLELRAKTALSASDFFHLFVEKVGYSSYLREQIHQEVKNAGDLNSQISAIQQVLRQK